MELIQLKHKDIKPLREKLFKEQGEICMICKEKIDISDTTLDHQHKLFKNQEIGEDGAGLCRGVLCKTCNAWEGKIFNAHRRLGLHKKENTLPELLRGLADYLEQENLQYIHPTEAPKPKKLKKSSFNALKRAIKQSKTMTETIEYPKSGKLTKQLERLFKELQMTPEFY